MSSKLTERDFIEAAKELSVTPAHVKAFAEVEAPNGGFYPSGGPTLLFERHIMYRLMREKFGEARAEAAFNNYPEICNPKSGGYGPSVDQPMRMDSAAKLLDRECALQSASWGKFQIMGFNWKMLGFHSLQAFVNAMYASESAQLAAFVQFILEDPRLHKALKNKDWKTVARIYNGPQYSKNNYDTKLESAFTKFGGV